MANDFKEIFSLDFDAAQFVANVEKSIQALSELEATSLVAKSTVERLSKGVASANFMTPANSVLKLNSAIKQVDISSLKLDQTQIKLTTTIKNSDKATREYSKTTDTATKQTNQFAAAAKKAETATAGFFGKVKAAGSNLLGALGITAGLAGLVALTKQTIDITAEMQKYGAVLANTLGSKQLAENALRTIVDFASKTPFSVSQLTESFVKLANQGFVPTVVELRKLGDLAASTGKDFNMLAEAILDAQTGEFERLKEFGIKGKVEGDKVTFAFKGIRTEIDNNSEAIRQYILSLGELDGVKNAMESISTTLTGQISNLGDAWDRMLTSFGNNSKGVFSSTISYVSDLLNRITDANEQINALNKYGDQDAGSVKNFLLGRNRFDEANGKRILDAQKAAQELLEIRAREAKSVEDFEKLKLEIYTKGNEAVEAEREKRRKQGLKIETASNMAVFKGIADGYSQQYKAANDLQKKFIQDQEKAKAPKPLTAAQKKAQEEALKLEESYQKKLLDIRDKVASQQFKTGGKSSASITAEYDRQYNLEAAEIQKTYGKLGAVKVKAMQNEAKALSDLQKAETLKAFTESQEATIKSINDLVAKSQDVATAGRIENIADNFQRENATIDNELRQQTEQINRELADRTKEINKQIADGLVTSADGAKAIADLQVSAFQQVENAEQASYRRRLDNTTKFFDDMLAEAREGMEAQSSALQVAITSQVLQESKRYADGEINYQQYEANIGDIKRSETLKKLDLDIKAGQDNLRILNQQLLHEADVRKAVTIKGQIDAVQAAINTAETQKNTIDKRFTGFESIIAKIVGVGDVEDEQSKAKVEQFKEKVTQVAGYAVNLLRQQAAQETASADRAIQLQQRRVDEAKRIADAGNAEYLQQEEEKLREVEAKREQAARKQMAIDAALQASQLLVAITGAVKDIAVPGAGIALVAANIATIVAALATGYGLVSSLSSQQPRFFTGADMVRENMLGGSDKLERGRHKVGRDTIPAWLHEGEAVIQADKNQQYNPTVRAIRRGLLPPDVLNGFVRSYSNGINYNALGSALRVSEGGKFNESHFIETNKRLARLENVMERTAESIAGLNVNVAMDSNGFAASITKHLEHKTKILNA